MKKYDLEDPEVSIRPAAFDALGMLTETGWKAGEKILIEFPNDVWDAPVLTGVGERIPNPKYPYESTQRYAFKGSPHERRIPRSEDGVLFVRYMKKKFEIKCYVRMHQSGKTSLVFKAEEI